MIYKEMCKNVKNHNKTASICSTSETLGSAFSGVGRVMSEIGDAHVGLFRIYESVDELLRAEPPANARVNA